MVLQRTKNGPKFSQPTGSFLLIYSCVSTRKKDKRVFQRRFQEDAANWTVRVWGRRTRQSSWPAGLPHAHETSKPGRPEDHVQSTEHCVCLQGEIRNSSSALASIFLNFPSSQPVPVQGQLHRSSIILSTLYSSTKSPICLQITAAQYDDLSGESQQTCLAVVPEVPTHKSPLR